jgi:hypothetical protein
MSKSQVVELINKLDYEKGVRRRFVNTIKGGLYDSHESFLSTPLLAILMLLTYEQNANIPDKIYLFYGKAFETLFHKHDALKEQYDRARKSGIAIDDFERIFSVFCLKTYVLEKTEFSRGEIISSIKDAIKFQGLNIKPEDFLFDIEEAVCLIQREGGSYFFVHRSFQEYFTAVFLANCAPAVRDEFMERVSTRYWDNVLPMLFDMAADQIEPTWVSDKVEQYLTEVGPSGEKIHPVCSRFDSIRFWNDGNEVHLANFEFGKWWRFIAIMMRFYPQIADSSSLDFEVLEEWITSRWDTLRDSHRVETANPQITMISYPAKDIPDAVMKKSGLWGVAMREYEAIKAVDKGLDREQKVKSEFLTKLFGAGNG